MLWNKINASKNVIFILGGPGTGKGTICEFLSKALNLYHISVGQLLRHVKTSDTEYNIVQKHMVEGTIVPSNISCKLIEKAIFNLDGYKIILVDGFPRNFSNYYTWEKLLSNKMTLLKIFHVTCDRHLMIERCLIRGKSSLNKRLDDEISTINSRISQYNQEVVPLIQSFHGRDLVETIDSNKSIKEVQSDVLKRVKSLIDKIESK